MIFGYLNRKRIKRLEERVDNINEFNRATLEDLKSIRGRIVKIEEFYATDFDELEKRLKKNISDMHAKDPWVLEIKPYLSETREEISKQIKTLSRLIKTPIL